MTSNGVKGVNALFDTSVSSKTNVQATNQTESFDETLNGMRAEKTDNDKNFSDVDSKNNRDDRVKRFETTGRKNPVKHEEEVTEEQIAAMSDEVAGQIKQMLTEKYDVSEEELNAIMDSLGITDENLLDVKALTQIVMKLEGVENQADMLTNPDFAKNLKEILSKVEEMKVNVKPESIENEKVVVEENLDETDMKSQVAEEVVDDDVSEEIKTDENGDTEVSENTEEVQATETLVTENASGTAGKNSDSSLKHDEGRNKTADINADGKNTAVQPQDFAQRLTEDLSERVGETKANDIVRQVVEQTQLNVKQGVTSLEMQLYPEHLGKVLVQVVSHEGSITAQITAESEAAKNALESQLTLLKENLNNQGVKVESVEVTIASHAFEQNMQGEKNNDQNSSQSKRRRSKDMFFDEVNDEQIEENDKGIMELKGSTVSYSA